MPLTDEQIKWVDESKASFLAGKGANERKAYIPVTLHPKQALFTSLDDEREGLFGGATGGGKTITLLADALKYVHVPHYSALLLRTSYPDLIQEGGLISVAHEWLHDTDATWNGTDKEWRFPSGARLRFGYLATENDKYRYQGGEYQFVGFDELTQFSESQYTYLFSRQRKRKDVQVPLRMRAATNPGGIGGAWVFERFIPDDFNPTDARQMRVWSKDGVNDEGKPFHRVFVPSMLDDNPSVERESYLESLDQLDEITRQQYVNGDWQIQTRGDILYTYSEAHSVISWSQFASAFGERKIPNHWRVAVYQDWGTTKDHPCVTSWFATAGANAPAINGVPMKGKVFLYRGLMLNQCTAREVAEEIKRLMIGDGEISRCHRWQMSHEASSERLEYRKAGLPFENWETGKTRGIEQLKNALQVKFTDFPHPFKPQLGGSPDLFLIVADDELLNPKSDYGLARWRAEFLAYHWATLKSGDVMNRLVPYALFNDAIDSVRPAAADYFPHLSVLTKSEKLINSLPVYLQPASIAVADPLIQQQLAQAQLAEIKEIQGKERKMREQVSKFRPARPKILIPRGYGR